MTIASADDVAERLGRPLNPDEILTVEALLVDTEIEIVMWGAGNRLTDPAWAGAVRKVECDVVLRAAQLSSKTTAIVPQLEDIDRGPGGTAVPKRPGVYLSRFDRRSLGLKLNGSVRLTQLPDIDPDWGWGWGDDCL